MSAALQEMAEEFADIKPKESEAAMSAVVRAIRNLADSGEIALNSPSDDDD